MWISIQVTKHNHTDEYRYKEVDLININSGGRVTIINLDLSQKGTKSTNLWALQYLTPIKIRGLRLFARTNIKSSTQNFIGAVSVFNKDCLSRSFIAPSLSYLQVWLVSLRPNYPLIKLPATHKISAAGILSFIAGFYYKQFILNLALYLLLK